MSNALLSSKIVVTEEAPRIRSFASLPTAVLGMVGIAERGPVGKAVQLLSFEEFVNTFGGYTLDTRDTVAAVEGFFEEGGQFLWFVRAARYTDIADLNTLEALVATGSISTAAQTAGPPCVLGNLTETFSLADADILNVSLNGGGALPSTFNAARAQITAGNTETYDFEVQSGETAGTAVGAGYVLADTQTLLISVDGEANITITFNTGDFANIALATVAELIAVIATQGGGDIVGVDVGGDLRINNARTVIAGRTFQVTGGTEAAFAFPGTLIQGYGTGDTVDFSVDGEATSSFILHAVDYADMNAATTAELIAAFALQFSDVAGDADATALRLYNARGLGTGFDLEILGTGTADATVLNFAGGAVAGTGDAADAAAVTIAEMKTLLEADIAGIVVTAVSSQIQICGLLNGSTETIAILASSTLDTKLGLSNTVANGNDNATPTATLTINAKDPGAYGDDVVIRIAAATSLVAAEFNLFVLEDGVIKEQFNNLSMDDLAVGNYIEDVINAAGTAGGSLLASVVDLDAALGTALLDRPANGDYTLAGGDNGLTNIADIHFIGSSITKNGIRALDDTNDVTLLAIPGRATAAVQNAMLTYAEVTSNGTMFAVLDPPAGQTAQEMVTYVETTATLLEASEFGAIYYPRVQVLNPSTTLFGNGDAITVPPSGHICGRYARTDASQPGGIYQPPAGITHGRLTSIVGLEILPGNEVPETFDVNKRDLLYPKRINPISEGVGGRTLDGVRTLKSTGNFPTIAERRGVTFIEVTTKNNLEPARFRNNDNKLRAEVTRSTEAFLTNQMRVGAFRSLDPRKAFSVDFGEGLNPASVIFAGQLVGRIGLATQKPAEFIILKFTQDTRALEQELSQP